MFSGRNYFRSTPIIKRQPDAPLVIRNPKFHSHWSWNLGFLTILNHELINVSQKVIHSFSESQHSGEPWGPGALGSQPESPLKSSESMHTGVSVSGKSRVTLIDSVQHLCEKDSPSITAILGGLGGEEFSQRCGS
jgi:hypothetical protein